MTIASNPLVERVAFVEACSHQEMHLLVRVEDQFKLLSYWEQMGDDPEELYRSYMAYFEISKRWSPLDCSFDLIFQDDDPEELLRTCRAIHRAGGVEVWGRFVVGFAGGDIAPWIGVDEFRLRPVDYVEDE